MATNKPAGDGQREGAVRKRSQLKTKTQGESTWTKRESKGAGGGQFMDQKESTKFKGVRRERSDG